MPNNPLTLENLADFSGGAVGLAFNQAVEQVKRDLLDRDLLKKPRTIALTLKFTPYIEHGADPGDIVSEVAIKTTLPEKSTGEHRLNVRGDGIHFNPGQKKSDLPGQQTFLNGEEED